MEVELLAAVETVSLLSSINLQNYWPLPLRKEISLRIQAWYDAGTTGPIPWTIVNATNVLVENVKQVQRYFTAHIGGLCGSTDSLKVLFGTTS